MSKINPLHQAVMVEEIKYEESTTGSGIILSQKVQEKIQRGVVVAIGDGCKEVSKKDTVYFIRGTGREFTDDGKEYIFVKEEDILAVKV